MLPKLVLTDIDGVWTDGGMYYDSSENEFKKFNTTDSAGVLFLRLLRIPLIVISGEDTPIVKRRCQKLKIDTYFLGVKNKLRVVQSYCAERSIDLNEVAYVGDDINDAQLLSHVGLSAVPFGAPSYVAKYAKLQLKKKGGEGAFREFIEYILVENNLLDKVLMLYFNEGDLDQ